MVHNNIFIFESSIIKHELFEFEVDKIEAFVG